MLYMDQTLGDMQFVVYMYISPLLLNPDVRELVQNIMSAPDR